MHKTQLFYILDKLLVVDAVCVFSGCFASSLMHEAGCLIKTWQLHTVVCVRVCACVYWQLQIAVKRTERTVYSLFSLKHRQHPSPLTERGGGRSRMQEGGVTGEEMILILKGFFFVFKAWIHTRYIRKRNAEASVDAVMVLSFFSAFLGWFVCFAHQQLRRHHQTQLTLTTATTEHRLLWPVTFTGYVAKLGLIKQKYLMKPSHPLSTPISKQNTGQPYFLCPLLSLLFAF